MLEYLSQVFRKFTEISPTIYAALGLLVLLGIALLITAPRVKWNAKMLATASLCIALSFVLSYVRLYRMPQGGSITLASMLPILMFAYAYGFGPGLICCMAYSLLQIFQDMYIVSFMQVMLDYVLAFSGLALVALFRNWNSYFAFPVGVIVASLFRVAMHVLAGVIFFSSYAEGSGHGPFIYSLLYNLSSVGVDGLIVAVLACIPAVQGLIKRLGTPGIRASAA